MHAIWFRSATNDKFDLTKDFEHLPVKIAAYSATYSIHIASLPSLVHKSTRMVVPVFSYISLESWLSNQLSTIDQQQ